jgi:hypothetical protein
MQLSDGTATREVGMLKDGWYFARKCDGWEKRDSPKLLENVFQGVDLAMKVIPWL